MDPIVHESYQNPKPYSNDIALLKLAEDIDLTTYTPACLPNCVLITPGRMEEFMVGCPLQSYSKWEITKAFANLAIHQDGEA